MGAFDAGMVAPMTNGAEEQIARLRKGKKPRMWQILRERGIRGIETGPTGDLSATPIPSTGAASSKDAKEEDGASCPVATRDIAVNLRHRKKAIETANYGPLNPNDANAAYWRDRAEQWDVSVSDAKRQRCGNCAAFIKTPRMLDCIEKGLGNESGNSAWDVIGAGDLGYCEAFDFKCASRRTCDAWIVGGPITSEGKKGKQESKGLTPWGKGKEPFDPNADDGDSDGKVQDGTQWERPATPKKVKVPKIVGLFKPKKQGEGQPQSTSQPKPVERKKIDWKFPLLGELMVHKPKETDRALFDKENNQYVRPRRVLHKRIVDFYRDKAGRPKPEGERTVYFMGGGPSSLKSTTLKSGITGIPSDIVRIDTDEIKEFLPEYREWVETGVSNAADLTQQESRHVSQLVAHQLIADGSDIVYDTTGNGNYEGMKGRVAGLRENGHRVVAHYMTNDVELAKKLNQERFLKTGRKVPEYDLEYIHSNVSRNVPKALADGLFDELYLYDTNDLEAGPRLILSHKDGMTTIHDPVAYKKFLDKGKSFAPPPNPTSAYPNQPAEEKLMGGLLKRLSEPDSGFSISMSHMSDVTSGWAIARSGTGVKIPSKRLFDKDGHVTTEGKELLLAYLIRNKEAFLGEPDKGMQVVLGGWHNPADGIVYFDVTEVHSKNSMTLKQAIQRGKENNQISIANLDEITAAALNNDWADRTTTVDTGGSGGSVMPLTDLNPILDGLRKNKGSLGPPSQRLTDVTVVTNKDDNVAMQMTKPIRALSQYHNISKDWREARAIPFGEMQKVANFYDQAPDLPAAMIPEETKQAYEALAKEVEEQFRILTKDLGISVEFTNEDPYENFAQMYEDFMKNKRLRIMKTEATGGHPFFTNEQNDMFRAVHDAFGHLGTGRGFDRHGEEAAFQAHRSMFSPEAAKAAATELRGQNAFLIARGFFGPQKLVLLPEMMRKWLAMLRILFKVAPMDGSSESEFNNSQAWSDKDNAYGKTGSHHVSCGRVVKR